MNFICAFRALKNSDMTLLIAKYRPKIISHHNKASFSTTKFPMDNITKLNRDVLLYSYDKTRLYKYLSVFGIAQFGVWAFYGGMMYMSLRDVSKSGEVVLSKDSPIWKNLNLGEQKYRITATILCLGVGLLTAVVCCVLPSRLIRELRLCKGGKSVSIITYGAFGKPLQHEFLLKNLSCFTPRREAKSYITIKIKPRWFFYLIDSKGKFHEPNLFDYTIGTRSIKAY